MDTAKEGLISDTFLIVVVMITLLLAAILTYIYSNKNLRLTLLLTGSVGGIFLFYQIMGFWEHYLDTVFVAGISSAGEPFRISRPGWLLLIDAWPLWLFPSAVIAMGVAGITYRIIRYKIDQKPPRVPTETESPHITSSSEVVKMQLEFEAFKGNLVRANEKLAEAVALRKQEENKNLELQMQIRQLLKEIETLKK